MSTFIWLARVLGRGGSPEAAKAIAVHRRYLLHYMRALSKALTLSVDFVFDTRS
jgi:hypothetical protein